MGWTKSITTLGEGEQVLVGRTRRVTPQTVITWTHECDQCGNSTTIFVINPKQPVSAFCCGKGHTPPEELLPKPGLLTRLLG